MFSVKFSSSFYQKAGLRTCELDHTSLQPGILLFLVCSDLGVLSLDNYMWLESYEVFSSWLTPVTFVK